jgi:hypothetical protein
MLAFTRLEIRLESADRDSSIIFPCLVFSLELTILQNDIISYALDLDACLVINGKFYASYGKSVALTCTVHQKVFDFPISCDTEAKKVDADELKNFT